MIEADLVRLTLGPLFLTCLLVILYLREKVVARLFMVIGALHVLGGAWVGREPLARIFQDGFFGQADSALGNVPSQMEKELVFWFLLWGAFTFLLGQLTAWVQSRGKRLPAHIGWELVAINLIAASLIPKGGFWLVLIPAFMMIRDARRADSRA
jgi:hypothetical protein